VAHEIFHCVQYETLTGAQVSGSTGWWREGSAEWFAALAAPEDTAALKERFVRFDEESPTVGLQEMSYQAVVFFIWYADRSGLGSVIELLRRMPPTSDRSAQIDKLRSILSQEQWLQFAQDYLDLRITGYGPVPVMSRPLASEWNDLGHVGTILVRTPPFAIPRLTFRFSCGKWSVALRPDGRAFAAQLNGTGPWAPVPQEVEAGPEGVQYRLVHINVGPEPPRNTRIEIGVLETCNACLGIREIDECALGTWRQTDNNLIELLNSRVPNIGFQQSGETPLLSLRRDGSLQSGMLGFATAGTASEGGYATLNFGAGGTWSAKGGKLNTCIAAAEGAAEGILYDPEHTMPFSFANQPGEIAKTYTCGPGSLETRMEIPGLGEVIQRYAPQEAPPTPPPPAPEGIEIIMSKG
jgi:hypothetical protein